MDYDLIIIGSGPAGLSAAQYGARANLKTLVIENGSVGGQVLNINDFENYPGVFPAVKGSDFINTMVFIPTATKNSNNNTDYNG